MESEEIVILSVVVALLAKFAILDNWHSFLSRANADALALVHMLATWKTIAIIGITLLPLILYVNYLINQKIAHKIREKKERQQYLANEEKAIEDLLKEKLSYLDCEELLSLIELVKEKSILAETTPALKRYSDSLAKLLNRTEKRLDEQLHQEKVNELAHEKRELVLAIEELEKQRLEKERKEVQDKRIILARLKVEENKVFRKEELEEKEIVALLENGYVQVNEYDVSEQRIISVLVKPVLNHSATHTFLVWSLQSLLKNISGVWKIKENETRDADITFVYNKRDYALEVETGNLLRKKHQLREKVAELNRKYQNRWLFVVSNKDLLSAYRVFGQATQRKEVAEKLQKMLSLAT